MQTPARHFDELRDPRFGDETVRFRRRSGVIQPRLRPPRLGGRSAHEASALQLSCLIVCAQSMYMATYKLSMHLTKRAEACHRQAMPYLSVLLAMRAAAPRRAASRAVLCSPTRPKVTCSSIQALFRKPQEAPQILPWAGRCTTAPDILSRDRRWHTFS